MIPFNNAIDLWKSESVKMTDNRETCISLWKQFKSGELTQAQLTSKLSELGLNDYEPIVKKTLKAFGGSVVNRGCQEDTPF